MPSAMSRAAALAAVWLWIGLAGCAGLAPPADSSGRDAECVRLLALVDAAVASSGSGDGGAHRVPGYPYLRVNRFLAGLAPRMDTPAALEFALGWMAELDRQARGRELENLPAPALERLAARLGEPADRAHLARRAQACAAALAAADRLRPERIGRLPSRLAVPPEYATLVQVAGLYPLAALPVLALTVAGQERFREAHRRPLEGLPRRGRHTAYLPAGAVPFEASEAAAILAAAGDNPLAAPRPPPEEAERLFRMFAPAILQDAAGPEDEIGAVGWGGRRRPEVDPAAPTLYTYLTHGLLKGTPVLQLNYAFWYPARTGPWAPAIERGPLDGLTVRISLESDGSPFMLEVVNNCGCYHFFVPRRERVAGLRRAVGELPPFVPRFLPEGFPRDRLLVRVSAGWHQVEHIGVAPPPEEAPTVAYRLEGYERLESLPAPGGLRASLFGPDGVARGSERIEPLLLFSMGIPSVGSMRQRGRHAILFIGRAHFDDPDLFDRYFEFR